MVNIYFMDLEILYFQISIFPLDGMEKSGTAKKEVKKARRFEKLGTSSLLEEVWDRKEVLNN